MAVACVYDSVFGLEHSMLVLGLHTRQPGPESCAAGDAGRVPHTQAAPGAPCALPCARPTTRARR